MDVDKLSDAELRTKLLEFGFPVMPITGTTRKVMAKKLKMLLENKNKIGSEGTRRSMGRYSSEEDSDSELKVSKKKENRRITMAAPIMQPPSVGVKVRKSTRFNESPEPENNVGIQLSRSPVKHESRTTTTTTTKTQKIIKSAQDEFDTGSESESDIVNNYKLIKGTSNFSKNLPVTSPNSSSVRYSPPKSTDTSYSSTRNVSFNINASPSRVSTYNSPSLASEYASDKLNEIRSRLSLNTPSYESPVYSSSLPSKEETPFLSNFTKRLSALSSQKNDQDYKKDIKEHDTNGSSTFVRGQLSSFRAARGRDTTYDYKVNQNNFLKNNFVSFAVLAGAALFFVVLAILYMGMRSDTSVISPDYVIPYCIPNDTNFKKGVNCIFESDVTTALELLIALKPELQKRAIANKCFDKTLKPHMTSSEIVNFCVSNYAIQDPMQIRSDLHNLEILIFNNPDWGIRIAQTENNNGLISEADIAKDMEQVIFHENDKITSLVIPYPDLPWKCTFYKTFHLALNSVLLVSLIFAALYLLNYVYKYYKHYQQKQKDEIGFMVEKIIDILQSSCGEEGGDPFLVINHVRDMILPIVDRQKKEKTWAKAVQFINENESRVRTEVQEVKGEPFEVWRWIGSANISMGGSPRNKSWQGQAFETQVGSVNSLPCSPTPCLKIRGMVEDGDRNMHIIREAVLSKCAHQCRILHCAVDTSSNCVYLKCADPNDAAIAYRNLHGWWYAGHLVTVKYLRLERYMQRFADSPVSGPPFLKAITPATDWSS
ncbi:LEM domain-containing inner nuclear membrane protein MAN1 isoform X2 [Leptinotarsa decemlineata]|uniref:LEM domain-containing inner nuclear membrane protein MAN1 isoform X2 n=1 Tax=Leptinotarsa decemlineata TaxID=7539 RepID=UPI003D30C04C